MNPGDPVAKVGKLDRVRVTVYVDEPDMGKVHKGEAVIITWDALPGHRWKGEVDKLPTQVVPLGTRQVGEVGCVIENPDRDLLPNANINADIQAAVVPGALVLPKEAFRRRRLGNRRFSVAGRSRGVAESELWEYPATPSRRCFPDFSRRRCGGAADGEGHEEWQ